MTYADCQLEERAAVSKNKGRWTLGLLGFHNYPVRLRGPRVRIAVQADRASSSLPTRTMNYWSRSSKDDVTLQADG